MASTSTVRFGSQFTSNAIHNQISHWLSQIRLSNFRNYQELEIKIDKAPVVLVGRNGAGKTNLMEAVSLLAPGRGLRRSGKDEIIFRYLENDRPSPKVWAMSTKLTTNISEWQIGTGMLEEGKQRIIKINQQIESQAKLAKICAVSWLTPQMDGLFLGSPNSRRHFLDRLAIAFDPAHSGRLSRYDKLYRERNRMLANEIKDTTWYQVKETLLAETGVAIMATRYALIEDINRTVYNMQTEFPKFTAELVGGGSELLHKIPAIELEDKIKHSAMQSRTANDASMMGPHMTDLYLTHSQKNQLANEASTGEQKALLITFILAHAQLQSDRLNKPPILLLDDVAALLDPWRRDALFDACSALAGQVWYSGSDERSFHSLKSKAQYFYVDDGSIN